MDRIVLANFGWNQPMTTYYCADGTEIDVKRQETVRFTRREQVGLP